MKSSYVHVSAEPATINIAPEGVQPVEFIEYMQTSGHEELAVWTDPANGVKAFIAIHDRTLGPALGGTRIWPHPTDEDAIMDVLRLSRAMTYKSAAAGLLLGGGKGLIVADPRTDKTEAMFRSYGRFVESLGGRYVTTEDVGANAQNMAWIAEETQHVVGLPEEMGGSGNPAGMTGFGVFQAMRACAEAAWGNESLEGRRVAVQGFGNAASSLASHLVEVGAELIVTDIHDDALQRAAGLPRTSLVSPDAIYDADCDVFAPCALGGVLNAATLPRLRCQVVCGAANNQLATPQDARRLVNRGIVYAPDFIANAGGVTNVYFEIGQPYDREGARAHTATIHETMQRVLAIADAEGVTTAEAANHLAEERLEAARQA